MATMDGERLPPAIPEPRHSSTSHEMLVEQLRQIAMYEETASVLEKQGQRCSPSPGSAVLRACARRRRERAAEIRASLVLVAAPLGWSL